MTPVYTLLEYNRFPVSFPLSLYITPTYSFIACKLADWILLGKAQAIHPEFQVEEPEATLGWGLVITVAVIISTLMTIIFVIMIVSIIGFWGGLGHR